MPELPARPISPREFVEEWLPRAFAESELPEAGRLVAVSVGLRLLGEEGGEWLLHLEEGRLRVAPGSSDEVPFAWIQSVEDWRGGLWGGRGGFFGRQAALLFRPGSAPGVKSPATPAVAPLLKPEALGQLGSLKGSVRIVVEDGEEPDWSFEVKLGTGAPPESPTATLAMSHEDAAALERGELNPVQAYLTGRLRVTGDLSLLMQLQAIQMGLVG